jgi:hypothetical protein
MAPGRTLGRVAAGGARLTAVAADAMIAAGPTMNRRVVLVLLGTVALNTAIAVALHAVGYSRGFAPTLLQSQSIGLSIAAACWSVSPWVERSRGAARVAVPLFAVALAVGVLGGMQLATLATRLASRRWPPRSRPGVARCRCRPRCCRSASAWRARFLFYGRERLRHERAATSRGLARVAAERSAAQAQLQALRAQVEPHFLFNTLASVSALIDRDPPRRGRWSTTWPATCARRCATRGPSRRRSARSST